MQEPASAQALGLEEAWQVQALVLAEEQVWARAREEGLEQTVLEEALALEVSEE